MAEEFADDLNTSVYSLGSSASNSQDLNSFLTKIKNNKRIMTISALILIAVKLNHILSWRLLLIMGDIRS